ncbi:uncharacterized protein [Nicotiana tomentosiformis]|uniref:uncharacterized protein n=1 Tax=Nicotiana tomentosiformis TaxID=4098 RepID=UPI00388C832E
MAVEMKQLQLQVFGDSQLVINQFLGSYEVKKPELCPYHDYAKTLMGWVGDVTIQHVPRKENKKVDVLAALASSLTLHDQAQVTKVIRGSTLAMLRGRKSTLSFARGTFWGMWVTPVWTKAPLPYKKDGILLADDGKRFLGLRSKMQGLSIPYDFIHQPPEVLHPAMASWPFDAWGLDVVGPLPKSSSGPIHLGCN